MTGRTIQELVSFLATADKKQGGCTVEFVAIQVPPGGSPVYGFVTYGLSEAQRLFHSEAELFDILERLS